MIENKDWQKFEKVIDTPKPLIVLTKSLTFRINSEAIKMFDLEKFNFVRILLNRQEDHIKIGFQFLKEKKEGTFSLFAKTSSGAMITAYSLLKKLGINKEKLNSMNRRFKPYTVNYNNGQLVVIDIPLNKPEEKESDKSENPTK